LSREEGLYGSCCVKGMDVKKPLYFTLSAEPPFRLDLTAWALRRRPGNIVDRFDGRTYRRVLTLGERAVGIAVHQPDRSRPLIEVTVHGEDHPPETQSAAVAFLERCLGIKRELSEFYALSARGGGIGRVIERFRGLKPVRFPSVFEALVNGIACQQISLAAGLAVLGRLVERAGMVLEAGEGTVHAFPRPSDVARLGVKDLREIGFSVPKSRYILELSKAVVEEEVSLEALDGLDNGGAMQILRRMRGIGRWTAEYALLRGLGRLDVFPGDDTGVRKKLLSVLDLEGPITYEDTEGLMRGWQPYSGFVYLHLLLVDLAARGYIEDGE